VKYLKTKEPVGLSWTAICVGGFFDWGFKFPRLMFWNLPARKATILDGGDTEFEVTNIDQIGRAVAASLMPEHFEETKNQYIYVNSFTVTQNQVLGSSERLTGDKFEVTKAIAREVSNMGLEKLKLGPKLVEYDHGIYADGTFEVIMTAICGYGGFNHFSMTQGLWNKKLGLPEEDF
jgi:hypothetical protein